MNRIKASIDEALHDVEVTPELKERTLTHIERSATKQRQYKQWQFILKGMTLVASFMLVMLLSLSYVFSGGTPESEAIRNYRFHLFPNGIGDYWLSDSGTEETTITESDEQRADEEDPFLP